MRRIANHHRRFRFRRKNNGTNRFHTPKIQNTNAISSPREQNRLIISVLLMPENSEHLILQLTLAHFGFNSLLITLVYFGSLDSLSLILTHSSLIASSTRYLAHPVDHLALSILNANSMIAFLLCKMYKSLSLGCFKQLVFRGAAFRLCAILEQIQVLLSHEAIRLIRHHSAIASEWYSNIPLSTLVRGAGKLSLVWQRSSHSDSYLGFTSDTCCSNCARKVVKVFCTRARCWEPTHHHVFFQFTDLRIQVYLVFANALSRCFEKYICKC